MNILFALYGGLDSNSAGPLITHVSELRRLGHECAVALPLDAKTTSLHDAAFLRTFRYGEVLSNGAGIFPDNRPADILHAWTPREVVRRFVTSYLAKRPTPWIIYLEDNEGWIARAALNLVGLREDVLLQHSEEVISVWTPEGLPHPLRYESFIGLADAAVVIQDKLAIDVPPWVPGTTVMPGVDLEVFSPQPADPASRGRYGIADGERVIVYPGGLNDFTRPGLEAICLAVGIINRHGVPCRLLRTGPFALDFLDRIPADAAASVTDLGVLPRGHLPGLLAMADVFVQPGKLDPFEDLRLPGKLPELFAMGRPVVLPNANIATLLQDGVNAVIHHSGSPEEIAEKCLALFADPDRARKIGEAGRRFAESHFDPKAQARRLESVYRAAVAAFDPRIAGELWRDDAEQVSAPALLARRLRLLAKAPGAGATSGSAMLEAHARSIEFTLERTRGLETGMEVRDRQIASLKEEVAASDKRVAELSRSIAQATARSSALSRTIVERDQHIAAVKASLSWRITHPLRVAGRIVSRFASYLRF